MRLYLRWIRGAMICNCVLSFALDVMRLYKKNGCAFNSEFI